MASRTLRVTTASDLDEYSFVFELDNGRWYISLETPNTDELVAMLKANPLIAVQANVSSGNAFRYSSRDVQALIAFVLKYWADL